VAVPEPPRATRSFDLIACVSAIDRTGRPQRLRRDAHLPGRSLQCQRAGKNCPRQSRPRHIRQAPTTLLSVCSFPPAPRATVTCRCRPQFRRNDHIDSRPDSARLRIAHPLHGLFFFPMSARALVSPSRWAVTSSGLCAPSFLQPPPPALVAARRPSTPGDDAPTPIPSRHRQCVSHLLACLCSLYLS